MCTSFRCQEVVCGEFRRCSLPKDHSAKMSVDREVVTSPPAMKSSSELPTSRSAPVPPNNDIAARNCQ